MHFFAAQRVRTLAIGLIIAWSLPATSLAEITWDVTIVDPGAAFEVYYAPIQSNLLAAAKLWSSHLVSSVPSSIQVEINFSESVPRATGESATFVYTRTVDGVNTWEQGVASEIRTGVDPNGSASDAHINFQPSFLTGDMWFDPNPILRTTPVPLDKVDAVSVFLHELGHAIAFNGWRDPSTGALPGGSPSYQSTFDQPQAFDGSNSFFIGPAAEALYGGPVPLTYESHGHIGNALPRPGSDLIPDLMNGVVTYRGMRYEISTLDLAILSDTGVSVLPQHPWQHVLVPEDVDAGGTVDALDALIIINELNSIGPHSLSAGLTSPPPFLDVNGDDLVTALDALQVINLLNSKQSLSTKSRAELAGRALTVTGVVVPEPSTIALALVGLLTLVGVRQQFGRPGNP